MWFSFLEESKISKITKQNKILFTSWRQQNKLFFIYLQYSSKGILFQTLNLFWIFDENLNRIKKFIKSIVKEIKLLWYFQYKKKNFITLPQNEIISFIKIDFFNKESNKIFIFDYLHLN